jgi:hypothetical protein
MGQAFGAKLTAEEQAALASIPEQMEELRTQVSLLAWLVRWFVGSLVG